jgi:catechol 2,3-dioxygenase-like lactoylglutathione lyase family enzyme
MKGRQSTMQTRSSNLCKLVVLCSALFLAGFAVGTERSAAAAPVEGSIKLNHVGLSVTNLPAAVEFYTKTMGFREVFRLPEVDDRPLTVYLQISRETFLELGQSAGSRVPGLSHIGLEVEGINSEIARLKRLNVNVGEPRLGRAKDINTIVVAPEGVRLELLELGPESLTRKAMESWR